jgi:hypothetical protein
MINSKTTLAVMAILAASLLVTGSFIATPSYASNGHKDKKDSVSGDGNTIIIQNSKGEAKASSSDVTATNTQSNCIALKGGDCSNAFPAP